MDSSPGIFTCQTNNQKKSQGKEPRKWPAIGRALENSYDGRRSKTLSKERTGKPDTVFSGEQYPSNKHHAVAGNRIERLRQAANVLPGRYKQTAQRTRHRWTSSPSSSSSSLPSPSPANGPVRVHGWTSFGDMILLTAPSTATPVQHGQNDRMSQRNSKVTTCGTRRKRNTLPTVQVLKSVDKKHGLFALSAISPSSK